MTSPAPEPNDLPPGAPPQGLRTFLSFLLFLHLFALLIAVVSNARPTSPLRSQLSEVPGVEPYLNLLDMNLAYNYHLTYADQLDTDHQIEVEVNYAPDSESSQTLAYPLLDAGVGLAAQRARNLTLNAAQLVGNDEYEGFLPRAIARRLLHEADIDDGLHRVRLKRHLLLTREAVGSADPERSDPLAPRYFVDAYEANLKFFDGELFLTGTASAGETAPVERPE